MQITAQSIITAFGFLSFTAAQGLSSTPQSTPAPLSTANGVTAVPRPEYSQCYNYFLSKDHCVFSAALESDRCSPNDQSNEASKPPGRTVPSDMPQLFKVHSKQSRYSSTAVDYDQNGFHMSTVSAESSESSSEHQGGTQTATSPPSRLVRRYDSESDSFTIAGGRGICGDYNEDQPGVCLHAPDALVDAASGGWLNGTYTNACGRHVYIQRSGDPHHTVYAPVVDGCSFDTVNPEPGCFRIAFTKATFDALKPTPKEKSSLIMHDLVWDFNNLYGDKPQNAAP